MVESGSDVLSLRGRFLRLLRRNGQTLMIPVAGGCPPGLLVVTDRVTDEVWLLPARNDGAVGLAGVVAVVM